MGRRHGRNQRRRARETIAALEGRLADERSARTRDRSLVAHAQSKEREHREALTFITNAIARICPNSSLLPPHTIAGDVGVQCDYLHIAIRPDPSCPQPERNSDRICLRTVELHRLETIVKADPYRLEASAHARVAGDGDSTVAYFLSREALEVGLHPAVREGLTAEIARQLLDAFERRAKGRSLGRPAGAA